MTQFQVGVLVVIPSVCWLCSGANDQVSIENDVMCSGIRRRQCLDAVRAGKPAAIDYQIADDDIARIDDLDGLVADLAKNDGRPVAGRPGDGDATAGRARKVRYSEAGVLSRRQDQRITGHEAEDHSPIIGGVGPENSSWFLCSAEIRGRRAVRLIARHSDCSAAALTGREGGGSGSKMQCDEHPSPHPRATPPPCLKRQSPGYSAATLTGSINCAIHLFRRFKFSRYIASNSAGGKECVEGRLSSASHQALSRGNFSMWPSLFTRSRNT